MSRIFLEETIEELIERYKLLNEAYTKILTTGVKEYTIGDRTLRKVEMAEYKQELKDIAAEIMKRRHGRGPRIQGLIPIPDK